MRSVTPLFVWVVCLVIGPACADVPSTAEAIPAPFDSSEFDGPRLGGPTNDIAPDPLDSFETDTFETPEDCADCYDGVDFQYQQGEWLATKLAAFHEFTSRNSQTHGRSVGLGKPLRGTSWMNRPYEASLDVGALFMTNRPASSVRPANDKFAAITIGWDWDHYWGSQARLGWSTPGLSPGNNSQGGDNLFVWDMSLMYYPWGDSRIRPYWRMGMGLTDIQFTNQLGAKQQEYLFTVPLGIGVKHQFRRWLVGRIEVADNLAFGMNETSTMNNFTLTAGFEARFGGRPTGYWAWQPRGYAW